MNDSHIETLEQLHQFLEGTAAVELSIDAKEDRYTWIQTMLVRFHYLRKRGFSFDFSESLEKVSGNTHLDIAAVELCDLCGRIEHRGEPLVSVRVDGGELGERETDINGEFCFADVRDGSGYTIRVSKEGYVVDTQTFSGNVSTNMPLLKTAARKLFTISGIVSHKGQPLAGVIVDGGDVLGTTTTDENGRYIFENVPEDVSYTIVASKDDFIFLAEK